MKTDDFGYRLPPERIAQTPLAERNTSRLMMVYTYLHPISQHSRTLHDMVEVDHAFVIRPKTTPSGESYGT